MNKFDIYWHSFWISYYSILAIQGVRLMLSELTGGWFYIVFSLNILLVTLMLINLRKLFKGE